MYRPLPWHKFVRLFKAHGATCSNRSGGSHYKVLGENKRSQSVPKPSRGDVKAIYVKTLRETLGLASMDDAEFFAPIQKAKGRK